MVRVLNFDRKTQRKKGYCPNPNCLHKGKEVYIAALGLCEACYARLRTGKAKKDLPEDIHNPDFTSQIKQATNQWITLITILKARNIPDSTFIELIEMLLPYFDEIIPHLAKENRQAQMLRPLLKEYIAREGIPVDVDVDVAIGNVVDVESEPVEPPKDK
jgi:hypothetical protein